jgi:hypothetical protein
LAAIHLSIWLNKIAGTGVLQPDWLPKTAHSDSTHDGRAAEGAELLKLNPRFIGRFQRNWRWKAGWLPSIITAAIITDVVDRDRLPELRAA